MLNLFKRGFWTVISMIIYKPLFGKMGFKSVIIKPLKINNSKRIFVESNVVVNDLAWLMAINKESVLSIAKGTRIGHFAHIVCLNKILIKDNVLIADKVFISDNAHGFEDIENPIKSQPLKFVGEVEIGENSWIGENVCILGCKIGRNSVIGANSVVTSDIASYCVAVGAPARVIKRYDFDESIWKKTNEKGDFINE